MEDAEPVAGTSSDLPSLARIQQFIIDAVEAAFRAREAQEGPPPAKVPRLDIEDAGADLDEEDKKV